MFESGSVFHQLRSAVGKNLFWAEKLKATQAGRFSLHLAILREPYLQFILEGKKTIESRFAKRACAPYQRISDGDVVILKRAGGDISGICLVERVWFYRMDDKSLSFIESKFGTRICPVNGQFWVDRQQAAVATLMLVTNVTPIDSFTIPKRDRRGWVVLQKSEAAALA
jgi:hypothetical protein